MNDMTPIEEINCSDTAVDLKQIVERARPVVMRGVCRDWPIVNSARESDSAFAAHLAASDNGTDVDVLLVPPDQGGVIGYADDFDAFNFEHHRVSITQVLGRLATYSRQPNPPALALQSALISKCLPNLLNVNALSFLDPAVQPRLWIGNKVTTPAHFDEYRNIACVVCGRRRFTLFPPEQIRNLYIGPLDFAPTGAAMSMARLDQPDDPRFPRLKEALAHAQSAELSPGDAIYIPPMWWHHVVSLERINALVNYWWSATDGDAVVPATSLDGLMHCILSFKSLGANERAAWRELLDYYVFGDEDPAAHIPEQRRGMLGPLTPELVEQLKAKIRSYL